MKAGLSLQELAIELHRQNELKNDYLVNTATTQMKADGNQISLQIRNNNNLPMEPFTVNSIAHQQLASYTSIPTAYYNRMLTENPELLTHNVNTWLHQNPELRLVRTLDGTARAFLSNRYRRIDNAEILEIVLPELMKIPDAKYESCQVTDSRMYIKVVNPRLQAEVAPGDIVQAGVIISNSEVGQGSVTIQPLVYRLVCSNGMVVNDAKIRKYHIGRATTSEDNLVIYSKETVQAMDTAFIGQIRDTVKAAVDIARFARVVEVMKDARSAALNTKDLPNVVELASKEFNIRGEEQGGILQHLIEGKELSLYGLSNAVTRFSQDVESYDRATELEGIGYKILTMDPRIFKRINQMAA